MAAGSAGMEEWAQAICEHAKREAERTDNLSKVCSVPNHSQTGIPKHSFYAIKDKGEKTWKANRGAPIKWCEVSVNLDGKGNTITVEFKTLQHKAPLATNFVLLRRPLISPSGIAGDAELALSQFAEATGFTLTHPKAIDDVESSNVYGIEYRKTGKGKSMNTTWRIWHGALTTAGRLFVHAATCS